MIAADPHQGGATWAVLQYLLGFERLGHDVLFVEQCGDSDIAPESAALDALPKRLLLHGRDGGTRLRGPLGAAACGHRGDGRVAVSRLVELRGGRRPAHEHLGHPHRRALLDLRHPVRVYLDLDPAFNQLWQVSGIDMRFDGHTHFVTVGQAIGSPDCPVPTCGFEWIPTVPPVVLERVAAGGADRRTTPSRRSATGAATARSSTRACTTARRCTRCGS